MKFYKEIKDLNYWLIILSILYIGLLMHLPVSIYTNAMHDDAMFWTHAQEISTGHWLGAYSQLTLPKGAGYPLFLAANWIIGIPITLSIGLLNLFSSWFLAKTLLKLNINKLIILLIFSLILFHPGLLPIRIVRDNIYSALTMISVIVFIRIFYENIFHDKFIKLFIYGLFLNLFWITREEGVWIVPALVFLLLIRYYQIKNDKLILLNIFKSLSVYLSSAILFSSCIALLNFIYYEKFELVDFKSNSFSSTLNILYSVDVGDEIPYFPVPYKKRKLLYEVSPTFSELQNYFEGEGRAWTIHGCTLNPNMCGEKADYGAGWFMWALRDAVASKGYYLNAPMAENFYARLNAEVLNACKLGTISCRTNIVPFMPKITNDQLKIIPEKIVNSIRLLVLGDSIQPTGGDSTGPLDRYIAVSYFLGNPKTTQVQESQDLKFSGWYYSRKNDWFKIKCTSKGDLKDISISRISSPDIVKIYNDKNAVMQHFSGKLPLNSKCSIYDNSSEFNGFLIPTTPLKNDLSSQKNNATLYIQAYDKPVNYEYILEIKNILVSIYSFVMPIVSIIGIFCFTLNIFRNKFRVKQYSIIYVISNVFWTLLFTRVILLILIEISSFSAVNYLYMSAAFQIIVIASLLSFYESINSSLKCRIPAG